jgi:phenylacetate-CoA ligase
VSEALILSLYHRMPAPVRSAAASLRGSYLRYLRYGEKTDELVATILERDHWQPEQWKKWQEERLSFILHRAATQVPYYRSQWAARRGAGDRSSWELLENWPALTKDALRSDPRSFVADDCEFRKLSHIHTSGTTGKSLDLWFSKEASNLWYALFEARWRRWYGVTRHDRWGILGGQLVVPVRQRKPPFWVWNLPLNQLYMSTYHLAPDLLEHYVAALRKYRVKYLYGYTSALFELAQEVLASGESLPMTVVLTNAEPLFDCQRDVIQKAFQCPVRETYGMAEKVAGASECEFGRLHLWPEVGIYETSPANELIATGLLNEHMPLIRYQVGDMVQLNETSEACPCGRALPMLSSIEGRSDDVLYTSDGRRIGRLDPVFKSQLPIREAQVIQEKLDRVRVKYVPTADFTAGATRSIAKRLQDRMGEIEIVFEAVDQIPRGPNGKFRAVVCNLPKDR